MHEDKPLWSRYLITPLIVIALCAVGWVVTIAPLVPSTTKGWLACAGALGLVFLCGVCVAALNEWHQHQKRFPALCKAIALLGASAIGIGILGALLGSREFIAAHFTYWHF